MRLIDADALKNELSDKDYITYTHEYGDAIPVNWIMNAIDNAPTVEREPFATVTFDKDELDRIVDERVIEPIKNGELVIKEERPTGEWTTIGEEQGALGIIYKIRRCSKCGWEHSLVIPDNFCPNCGATMRKEQNND